MLTLTNHIKINIDTINATNLVDKFTDEDLQLIGSWMEEQYEQAKQSRQSWFDRTEAAMDLAMQVQKEKTFPWPGCSNIIFPLVTIAAMQFHARAYPSIVNGQSVVQMRVIGADPEGIERARADRISKHMSYQLLEEDECWEEEMDRALLNVSIVGCGFKKTYRKNGKNISSFVPAKNLIFDYWARSVEECAFKTHEFPMYRNEIYERVKRQQYKDILEDAWFNTDAQINYDRGRADRDDRLGQDIPEANSATPYMISEHHCWLDLDGDGYEEPYIVTTEQGSKCVLRIVARFNRIEDVEFNSKGEIISIAPMEYFTKIPFIPSPDGGVLDIGFGTLLGPLNESVDAAINQLFDAGTLSNTAGGFLGRGAKIRGGVYEFRPFGWNRVDSTGDDLRKNVFPLPVREPSGVMFNLLSLIIDFTNRVSGTTDMMVGQNPGQNTPAETSRTMMEQGQKIYSAIFKRIWRSMKNEFKKLYLLNGLYLPTSIAFGDSGDTIAREDYTGSPMGIVPAADPNITSDVARFARAQMIRDAALMNPAGYDQDSVERLYLKSMGIDQIDQVYPGIASKGAPGPSEKVQIQQMKMQVEMAKLELARNQMGLMLQETMRLNNAKILQLQAQSMKLQEEAGNTKNKQQIEAFRASIELIREQNKNADSQMKTLMEIGANATQQLGSGTGPMGGMEGASNNSTDVSMGQTPAF